MATGLPFRSGFLTPHSATRATLRYFAKATAPPPEPAPNVPAPVGVDSTLGLHTAPTGRRGTYLIVAAVAIVIILLGAIGVVEYYHHMGAPGSDSRVLAQDGWSATMLPYGQFGEIPFTTSSPANLTGSFETTAEITVYVVNSTTFAALVRSGTLNGWQYSSGQLWYGNINDTVPAGSWDLLFFNTNPVSGTSGVSVTNPVVLTPV
jgi:hypothetical protein